MCRVADVVRLINKAKEDKNIVGLHIIANSNPNGFANSEDIRNALINFKASKKFIIASGDDLTKSLLYC
jgi:protease-4